MLSHCISQNRIVTIVNVHVRRILWHNESMPKSEATLRIDIFERGNPRCSVCGQEFGSEGFATYLIEAFALHVRRRHMQDDMGPGAEREYVTPTGARIVRAGAQQQ